MIIFPYIIMNQPSQNIRYPKTTVAKLRIYPDPVVVEFVVLSVVFVVLFVAGGVVHTPHLDVEALHVYA